MKPFFLAVLWLCLFIPGLAHAFAPFPADTSHFYTKHSYDVLKYKLDIGLYQCFMNPYPRTFHAKEVITLKVDSVLSSIRLNAISTSLTIDSVRLAAVAFQHLNDTLT